MSNNLTRVFGEKPDTKFKDKYTNQVFTVEELNTGFLAPTVLMGPDEVKKLEPWFERFEKVKESE